MAKRTRREQGGLQIGGGVTVSGGDFVAGDKVNVDRGGVYAKGDIRDSTLVTGDHDQMQAAGAEQAALFVELLKKIDQGKNTTPAQKEELKHEVQMVQAEAAKGEQAGESFLTRRIHNIEQIAPDIADVMLATLANPAAGFALVVKKVAARAVKQAHPS
jgi:hypothetical protein